MRTDVTANDRGFLRPLLVALSPFDDRFFGYAGAMRKPVIVVSAVLVAPVVVLGACATNQPSGKQPPVSSPSATATAPPPGTERLIAQLNSADGTPVANATLDFANGFATISVETVAAHVLKPGFHGLHIHSVGKCEPNSVAPTGGPSGDFNSAGGHFQAPGHTGAPASGDLTSLEVRSDGSAKLVTTTEAFTAADLLAGEKTVLMIHDGPDNFGNIPPRYTQNGTPGPDAETLATGDSGKRVACGVIGSTGTSGTAATTATTTAAPTTAATTTAGSTATTGGATTTAPTSEPSATSAPTSSTPSTSTVTVTVPTVTTPTNPPSPGNPGG
jgi:superoxide dismutase, Cu-Zn family